MPVRATMAALIARVRLMINDTLPLGSGQVWLDQDIQNVLDESRMDYYNLQLKEQWTFSGTTPQVLDYFAPKELGNWEDDFVIKQYLTVLITATTVEDIPGHFQFTATTLPPCFITGKTYDIYRASADLLERWSAKYALLFNVTVDGQSVQRSQAHSMLLDLAKQYRMKQRAGSIALKRADLGGRAGNLSLGPQEIDYMGSG